jgi:hypothetical protein
MSELTPVEKAVYDAMIDEATPQVRDRLYGLEGEEIARAVVAAARGPILAEAAEALASFIAGPAGTEGSR